MKTIYQQTESDCGPASVAMLCNVGLKESTKFIHAKMGRKGRSSSGYLIKAISHFGREPLSGRCRSVEDDFELAELDYDALLGCDCLIPEGDSNFTRSKHWAVWDSEEQCIRDPYGYEYPLLIKKYVLVK